MLLEGLNLALVAPGTVDVQFVAHTVDFVDVELTQHGVQNLWQTQTLFTADNETGDRLAFQQRLSFLYPAAKTKCKTEHMLST